MEAERRQRQRKTGFQGPAPDRARRSSQTQTPAQIGIPRPRNARRLTFFAMAALALCQLCHG